jgi:hypothetical protein
VKLLRGFGKNYFRLTAIQAYSSAQNLHAQLTTYSFFTHIQEGEKESECEEESPPDLEASLLPLPLLSNKKPCHCNAYFTHLSKLMVLLNHYIPRCPYYTTYFAFRRSGVHPPFLSF